MIGNWKLENRNWKLEIGNCDDLSFWASFLPYLIAFPISGDSVERNTVT